jgi:signal transduction histidine kinase/CheY-like chemotaxis protein
VRDALLAFVGVVSVLGLLLLLATRQEAAVPVWVTLIMLLGVAVFAAAVIYRLRTAVRDAMTVHESRLSALEVSIARDARAKDHSSSVLATMSHELRTPLTAILGFTDLLLDPGYDVTVLRSHAQTIRRNGQHLLNVLNDVLDISKIEAGTLRTENMPFDPLQVANDVIDLLEPRAREKRIELSFWAGADDGQTAIPPQVDGDAFRLRQILINLVGNAVKFTEEGSVTLSVRYDHARRELSYEVADTGVGIEPDQMSSLFEPFHQADASVSRRSQGAGLGLAISKRLALHLGGDLRVQSDPARGSTFTLRVPAAPSAESVAATHAGQTPAAFETWIPRPSWRILLVEDTLEHQKLFYACLRRAGHSVDVCDNGERAVHKVRESEYLREPYTIVLLDVYLPGQDGFATATEMRAHGYLGPILAITADTSAETREQCLAAGCDEIYAKPLERGTLLTALTRLVRGASIGAA